MLFSLRRWKVLSVDYIIMIADILYSPLRRAKGIGHKLTYWHTALISVQKDRGDLVLVAELNYKFGVTNDAWCQVLAASYSVTIANIWERI